MKVNLQLLGYLSLILSVVFLIVLDATQDEPTVITKVERVDTYTKYCQHILDGKYVYSEVSGNNYCKTEAGYILMGVD